jgi:hypothetical protein
MNRISNYFRISRMVLQAVPVLTTLGIFLKTRPNLLHPGCRCILESMWNKMKCKSPHIAIIPQRSQLNKQTSDYYICLPYKEIRYIYFQISYFVLNSGTYKQFPVSWNLWYKEVWNNKGKWGTQRVAANLCCFDRLINFPFCPTTYIFS